MNSVTSTVALLVLAFVGSADSAIKPETMASFDAEQLVVEGRIVLLQGACNAVRCPDIQYEIAVTKIRQKPIDQRMHSDATFAILKACGQSGLILGGHYLFSLQKNVDAFPSIIDRPSGENGAYLECAYVFSAAEVNPVPLSRRF